MAELLLSHGADAGAVDREGHDALHYALRTRDKALWRLLRQALNRRQRGGKSSFVISRFSSITKELKKGFFRPTQDTGAEGYRLVGNLSQNKKELNVVR